MCACFTQRGSYGPQASSLARAKGEAARRRESEGFFSERRTTYDSQVAFRVVILGKVF